MTIAAQRRSSKATPQRRTRREMPLPLYQDQSKRFYLKANVEGWEEVRMPPRRKTMLESITVIEAS
uniref:Uncharacterized protein n=1 Tax=Oryza sativa subsp. japonica TaxID=39947 RepID=Q6ZI42_ORYSJ|nr:hypothetical protein [Oryza sativa Japonica Group]BAD33272.1 hypothetical protein [Oryza sativa Japonica Group]